MRVHLVAGQGALAKRVALLLPVIVLISALLMPSTSVAGNGHAKHQRKHKHHRHHRHHRSGSGGAAGTPGSLQSHGQTLKLAGLNTNRSSNWFGYNQGAVEQGGKFFHSVTGNWTVPTATRHTSGQDESSSDWIGIGGGCVDSGCSVGDETLIQTGTEQDVSSSGAASYSAWYELIPAPSIAINHPVKAGDQMQASIAETVPNSEVWTITLTDMTQGWTFNATVPYPSSHDTAEWIEETPLVIGTNAGFAALPNLTKVTFTHATTDVGAPLQASEEMDLIDSNGKVIGAPSAPLSSDSFDACAWASSCN